MTGYDDMTYDRLVLSLYIKAIIIKISKLPNFGNYAFLYLNLGLSRHTRHTRHYLNNINKYKRRITVKNKKPTMTG